MRLTINVTQGDIDSSMTCDSEEGPISKATTRALIDAGYDSDGVLVGIDDMYICRKYAPTIGPISLPEHAVRFVRDFDLGRPVAPFSLEIELPDN